jgi:SAM-dependent methyltransferase
VTSLPSDYDDDPGRFTAAQTGGEDVHDTVGPQLAERATGTVLDLGCGRGRLLDAFPTDRWVGLDGSPAQLAACPASGRTVLGDGAILPFADASFDGVAALYCLYHFEDPHLPIAESHRVLRPGGWFVTCTPSLRDAPELVTHLVPSSFDAETAELQVGNVFGAANVGAEWWDGPYVQLPDDDALRTYARGHLLREDQLRPEARPPLTLTKRGIVVWARKVA